MAYKRNLSIPLAPTFGDDDKKKKKTKKKTVNYTEKDLTDSQKKKINSINLSPSAKQKAINAFAKMNKNK